VSKTFRIGSIILDTVSVPAAAIPAAVLLLARALLDFIGLRCKANKTA